MKTGERYKVTISGISAHLLGEKYDVSITTTAGVSSIKVSALSYAYACMNDDNPAKMLVSALYDYYLKANAYKNSQNNE